MMIVAEATKFNAAGTPPKMFEEFIGSVNTGNSDISVARMRSPQGWSEPGQTPQFDEYTIVLKGALVVEDKHGKHEAVAGQAVVADKGKWVKYSTPYEGGAEYIAICIPAFSPGLVNRDD
jgi:hypothetical protein